MATAIFRINQGVTLGDWGRARQDLELFSTGGSVTFEAQVATTYEWTLVSQPSTSTAVLVNPANSSCTIDIDVTGGYLVRLIVDKGTSGEDVMVLYFGVPLENSGLAIPALNELDFDNSESPYDGRRGWESKLMAFLRWADANSVAGISPFELGSGSFATQRKLVGCDASGDYSFAVGKDNIASGIYSESHGLESEAYWPAMWALSAGKLNGTDNAQVGVVPVYGKTTTVVVGGFSDIISSIGQILDPSENPHTLKDSTSYACTLLLLARFEEKTAAWNIEFAMRREGDAYLVSSPNYNKFAQYGAVGLWDVSVEVNATYQTLEIKPFSTVANVAWVGQLRFTELYEDTAP